MGRSQTSVQRIKAIEEMKCEEGKCSQNKRALVETEARGHVQETSQGQLHHSAGSFRLISPYFQPSVSPHFPLCPGFPKPGASLLHFFLSEIPSVSSRGRRQERVEVLYTDIQLSLFSALCRISTCYSTW